MPFLPYEEEEMYCMASVIMTNWIEYDREYRALKARIFKSSDPLSFRHSPLLEKAHGFIMVIDWDGERILAAKKLPKPLGFTLRDRVLYVVTWGGEDVRALQGNEVIRRFQHPWFNELHSIDATPDGFLVTSSGTDLIAELDMQGRIVWEYFLFEHGYGRSEYRLAESFRRSENYNRRHVPSNLGLHVNSAILVDRDTVLATVFRSNELVRINRRTSEIEVVLRGLRRPHSLRRRPHGGYLLSNTEAEEAILLDSELRREGVIPVPMPWIQDTVVIGDRVIAAGGPRMPSGPMQSELEMNVGKPTGILELTLDGTLVRRLDLGPENRLYMVEPVEQEVALTFADAWHYSGLETIPARWETSKSDAGCHSHSILPGGLGVIS